MCQGCCTYIRCVRDVVHTSGVSEVLYIHQVCQGCCTYIRCVRDVVGKSGVSVHHTHHVHHTQHAHTMYTTHTHVHHVCAHKIADTICHTVHYRFHDYCYIFYMWYVYTCTIHRYSLTHKAALLDPTHQLLHYVHLFHQPLPIHPLLVH